MDATAVLSWIGAFVIYVLWVTYSGVFKKLPERKKGVRGWIKSRFVISLFSKEKREIVFHNITVLISFILPMLASRYVSDHTPTVMEWVYSSFDIHPSFIIFIIVWFVLILLPFIGFHILFKISPIFKWLSIILLIVIPILKRFRILR